MSLDGDIEKFHGNRQFLVWSRAAMPRGTVQDIRGFKVETENRDNRNTRTKATNIWPSDNELVLDWIENWWIEDWRNKKNLRIFCAPAVTRAGYFKNMPETLLTEPSCSNTRRDNLGNTEYKLYTRAEIHKNKMFQKKWTLKIRSQRNIFSVIFFGPRCVCKYYINMSFYQNNFIFLINNWETQTVRSLLKFYFAQCFDNLSLSVFTKRIKLLWSTDIFTGIYIYIIAFISDL